MNTDYQPDVPDKLTDPVAKVERLKTLLGTEWADKRIKTIVRVESDSPDRWGWVAYFD